MFHAENRKRFIERTQGALVIVAGHDQMQLSGDMAAPFLQESNFWWLSGIESPGWKMIIDGARGRATLVRPALSAVRQIFDGDLTDDQALVVSGADVVITEDYFDQELKQLARAHPRVLTTLNKVDGEFHANPAQQKLKARLDRIFVAAETCNKELAELRAIKQPTEIERIKKAIKITTDAFAVIKDRWVDYKTEYEVEADFTQYFRRHNAAHGYDPIVAAGPRACTLHYHANGQKIARREAVVVDIGARYAGYSADITRTFCESPSKRVSQVHKAVADAHNAIIKLLEPDLLVSDYIKKSDEIMLDTVMSLGLIESRGDTNGYRRYFPHAVSHGLGVDVHDSLGAPRYLRAGMVITVEPGIYIPAEAVGVRIEDDILITDTGRQNLSAMLSTDL